jgi:hypothetical protein
MSAIPQAREVRLADGRVELSTTRGSTGARSSTTRAVAATALGCALAWGGLVVPLLAPLYSYSWFVGFRGAALVHWSLMRLPHGRAHDFDHDVEARRAFASVAARAPLRPPRSN